MGSFSIFEKKCKHWAKRLHCLRTTSWSLMKAWFCLFLFVMPFNLFKKKPKGEDRGRSSSSSGPSSPKKDEKEFRRSLSVGSIFEKTSKYDTIGCQFSYWYLISIDEGDSPIDYDPSGAVTFIVKVRTIVFSLILSKNCLKVEAKLYNANSLWISMDFIL